jgi:hypothetical protein
MYEIVCLIWTHICVLSSLDLGSQIHATIYNTTCRDSLDLGSPSNKRHPADVIHKYMLPSTLLAGNHYLGSPSNKRHPPHAYRNKYQQVHTSVEIGVHMALIHCLLTSNDAQLDLVAGGGM